MVHRPSPSFHAAFVMYLWTREGNNGVILGDIMELRNIDGFLSKLDLGQVPSVRISKSRKMSG